MRNADDSLGGPSPAEGSSPRSRSRRPEPADEEARVRDRRTWRVVHEVDAWSVLKVSAIFYATLYCILLVAGVILWTAATLTGLRHNIEKFIADLIASGQFHFVPGELFRAAAITGAVLVVMGASANVLLVVLYNLISDMVGGVTMVVEDRAARLPAREAGRDPLPTPTLVPEADLHPPRAAQERAATPIAPSTSNL